MIDQYLTDTYLYLTSSYQSLPIFNRYLPILNILIQINIYQYSTVT